MFTFSLPFIEKTVWSITKSWQITIKTDENLHGKTKLSQILLTCIKMEYYWFALMWYIMVAEVANILTIYTICILAGCYDII